MNKTTTKTLKITTSISLCLFVGFLGSIATKSSVNEWYTTINKPFFNPPNIVFPIVWTCLFVLMGISFGLIWNKDIKHTSAKKAAFCFLLQLLINLLWSVTFFGMQQISTALLVVFGLLMLLLLTFKWFRVVHKTAAYLLIPYIAWVGFAFILNFAIWWLN